METSYSWLVAAASLLITSLSFGAVTSIPILMNPMITDLGWTRSTVGMAHVFAMVAAGIAGFWLGRLADRLSFAVLSVAGGLAIGIGLWLASSAVSPWSLYLPYALLVGAIGQGAFFGPITAIVSHWFDRNRGLAMSIVMCGQSVGGLTVPVVLRAGAEGWGWRSAMMGYGLFCSFLIVFLSIVFARRPPIKKTHAESSLEPSILCSSKRALMFVRIILPLMFCNSGAFILIAHMVALGEERGLTPMRASVLLAVTFGITIISRLSSGALIDKGLQRAVLYISTLLLPIGGLVLLLGGEFFFLSILAVVLLGLGYGGVFPFYTFFVRSVFPAAAAGTWISAMFMFGFFAAALGSWLGAFLHDLVGDYRLAIWVSILLTTMSALIAAILLEEALCADRPGTHS